MTYRLVAVGTLAATALIVSGVGMAAVRAGQKAGTRRLTPPVIHETFTPQPCTGKPGDRTTLAEEGCAERSILSSDKSIDALNAKIFAKLFDGAARSRFVAGHKAWLAYRAAFCTSESDVFEGGTEAAVIAADCTVGVNTQHVSDLTTFLHDLDENP